MNTPPVATDELDAPSQYDAVISSTVPNDTSLVDEFTERIAKKIKDAAEDGKFSMGEIASLTVSVVSGTQMLFPSLRGSNKQEIALTVIHTAIKGLILMGILNPEFTTILAILPGLINSLCSVAGGIEKLWEKYIPDFFKWLKNIVWGDDPETIEPSHVEKVVAHLDILHPTGIKM